MIKLIMKTVVSIAVVVGFLQQAQSEVTAAVQTERIKKIVAAFNETPEQWIEPVTAEDVEIGQYEGRVVVNKKSKFTYYAQIEESENVNSKITLIPMSTSRFTPTYYQTDEWWDAHKEEIEKARKEGKPAPKQDMNEVAQWLTEMKLSTNPDVIVIEPNAVKSTRVKLQDYLLNVYVSQFAKNGKVTLFRGAEKPNELDSWEQGQTPKGVRYWTPTANYAWRYARKNTQFLDLMLQNKTPLFKYEIPVEEFKTMVKREWRWFTLGTELTKNAHDIFDKQRYFGDHLFNSTPFLGIGDLGVEFEARSNRAGAHAMVKYYKGPATVQDMSNDRIEVLQRARQRLSHQLPKESSAAILKTFDQRIATAQVEGKILTALKTDISTADLETLLAQFGAAKGELSNIDGVSFVSWARAARGKYISK